MKAKHLFLSLLTATTVSLGAVLPALARPAVLTGAQPGSQVNVRSAPSTQAATPHYGLVGDRVEVLRSTQAADGYTWHYVQFASGAKGWVRADFVRLANNSPIAAILIGDQPGSRINVRSAPSTQSTSPHYGLVGDRVQILRSIRGNDGYAWHYVRFASKAEGWVRSTFVRPLD